MIRRDDRLPDGRLQWLLIEQQEHARLAGQLARGWAWDKSHLAASPPAELLAAIDHHDDGWAEWDAAPQVDPDHGRPRDFKEMPLESSLAIWRASIERCVEIGDLAAWVVAGHFSRMLRHSDHGRTPSSQRWLAEFDGRRTDWLARWQQTSPARHTVAAATQGLDQLQRFDAMSLWFCCQEGPAPETFVMPSGQQVTLAVQGPNRATMIPWSLSDAELRLTISATAVRVKNYPDSTSLAAAQHTAQDVCWRLTALV